MLLREKRLLAKTRWFVMANRVGAVFYSDGVDQKFHFIDRLENKKGNYLESELDADKAGQGYSTAGGGMTRHALDRRSHKHEVIAKKFAQRIAKRLQSALIGHQLGEIVLVAEPHFLGLLKAALPVQVARVAKTAIAREYVRGSDQTLRTNVLKLIGGHP